MVFGYVLISTKNSYEHEVANKIKMFDETVDVEPLLFEETTLADPFFKDYNLIAKIKSDNSKNLREVVDKKILNLSGVEKIKVTSRSKL